jgi:hypothetical protein
VGVRKHIHRVYKIVVPTDFSSGSARAMTFALAEESMARWLQEGKFSVCDSIVIEGEPAPAIVRFAVAKGADLVVLATSARRHAARFMLGSIAEEIFRESRRDCYGYS